MNTKRLIKKLDVHRKNIEKMFENAENKIKNISIKNIYELKELCNKPENKYNFPLLQYTENVIGEPSDRTIRDI